MMRTIWFTLSGSQRPQGSEEGRGASAALERARRRPPRTLPWTRPLGHFRAPDQFAVSRLPACPAELKRADYAVSSNICRTMDAARQAVIDVRCCFDWLE